MGSADLCQVEPQCLRVCCSSLRFSLTDTTDSEVTNRAIPVSRQLDDVCLKRILARGFNASVGDAAKPGRGENMKTPEAPGGVTFIEFALIAALLIGCGSILVPELAAGVQSANEQAVRDGIEVLRRQIELYQKDHGDRLPAHGTNVETTFVSQLTLRTCENGLVEPRAHFGPYILGGLPSNPFHSTSRVLVIPEPLQPENYDGSGNHGWAFSSTTGEVRANAPARLLSKDGTPINCL